MTDEEINILEETASKLDSPWFKYVMYTIQQMRDDAVKSLIECDSFNHDYNKGIIKGLDKCLNVKTEIDRKYKSVKGGAKNGSTDLQLPV